jgi:cytochrome c biogenesis protein
LQYQEAKRENLVTTQVEDPDSIEQKQPSSKQDIQLLEALWALFSSMRTAIVLLLLVAAASIIGTLIPQRGMPQDYVARYGQVKYALLQSLDFTNVYQSPWYKVLLALVGINLIVCNINRLGITWRLIRRPKVSMPAQRIAKMHKSETMSSRGAVEDVAGRVAAALRSGSYRVVQEQDGSDVALYASKGTLNIFGPLLTHVSILVIFLGAILGNLLGFQGFTAIDKGESTSTYQRMGMQDRTNLGFRVKLNDFRIEHDKEHNPIGFKSDLSVYEADKLEARKVIDVNQPLSYNGVLFNQADYGVAGCVLKVAAPDGRSERIRFDVTTEDGPMGKQYAVSGMPFKTITMNGTHLTIFLHDFSPDFINESVPNVSFLPINPAVNIMVNEKFPISPEVMHAWVQVGWLPFGKSIQYKGYTISMADTITYTGLEVSQNPGLPTIYVGFGLLLTGVFLSFYITRMVIRVRVSPAKNGVSVVAGATSKGEIAGFDRDFDRLRRAAE